MKGGENRETSKALDDLFGGREWRTGTYIDRYTPIYRLLLDTRGIREHEANQMDITNVALTIGVPARGPDTEVADVETPVADEGPILGPDGLPVPGTAPVGIKPPSWWRGDREAFRTSTRAADQLAGHQGGMGANGE